MNQTVICLGAHVFDVQLRPVEAIPDGQVVAATRGAKGALVVTEDATAEVPAFAVDVVDTTGCGDAFSAGFLRGVGLGRDVAAAAQLGCTAAALVAQGLGSDHGDFDPATADAFAETTPTLR